MKSRQVSLSHSSTGNCNHGKQEGGNLREHFVGLALYLLSECFQCSLRAPSSPDENGLFNPETHYKDAGGLCPWRRGSHLSWLCPRCCCGAVVGRCSRPLPRQPHCPAPRLRAFPTLPSCEEHTLAFSNCICLFVPVTRRAVDEKRSDNAGENQHKPPFSPAGVLLGMTAHRSCMCVGRPQKERRALSDERWSWSCLT